MRAAKHWSWHEDNIIWNLFPRDIVEINWKNCQKQKSSASCNAIAASDKLLYIHKKVWIYHCHWNKIIYFCCHSVGYWCYQWTKHFSSCAMAAYSQNVSYFRYNGSNEDKCWYIMPAVTQSWSSNNLWSFLVTDLRPWYRPASFKIQIYFPNRASESRE